MSNEQAMPRYLEVTITYPGIIFGLRRDTGPSFHVQVPEEVSDGQELGWLAGHLKADHGCVENRRGYLKHPKSRRYISSIHAVASKKIDGRWAIQLGQLVVLLQTPYRGVIRLDNLSRRIRQLGGVSEHLFRLQIDCSDQALKELRTIMEAVQQFQSQHPAFG